ncbi:MAG TPA: hypothetical protein VF895_07245 [Gaiellaceae bacterium]
MAIRWTRTALDARLAALEEKHEGPALIEAVVSFADTLTGEDRRLLQDVLLERAGRDQPLGPDDRHWTDDVHGRFFRRGLTPKRRRRPR